MLVVASWKFLVHPTEELLEDYALGRVSEPALADLDEHLLSCDLCLNKAVDFRESAAALKIGLAEFERNQAVPRRIFRVATPASHWANLLIAAGIAGLLLVSTLNWRPKSALSPAFVRLSAMRGGGLTDGLAEAPAGRPLELIVDATSLPASAGYRLDLVSQSGQTIWTGDANLAGGRLSARVPGGVSPGIFWVRLYSAVNGASPGELLREFGIRVR